MRSAMQARLRKLEGAEYALAAVCLTPEDYCKAQGRGQAIVWVLDVPPDAPEWSALDAPLKDCGDLSAQEWEQIFTPEKMEAPCAP